MSTPDATPAPSQVGSYPADNVSRDTGSSRKRCDEQLPVCSNCQRAGAACDKAGVASQTLPTAAHLEYTRALETRVAQLEGLLAQRDTPRDSHHFLPPSPNTNEVLASFPARPPDSEREHGRDMSALSEVVGIMSQGNFEAPAYVGPSAGLSLAVNLGEMVQATIWQKAKQHVSGSPSDATTTELQMSLGDVRAMTGEELVRHSAKEPPTDELGERLLKLYLQNAHLRYPFLDPDELWRLHKARTPVSGPELSKLSIGQRYGIFKLYMVFAIGATLLQLTSKGTNIQPEEFYMTALQHTAAVEEPRTIRNIEAMTLLAVYHLRSASGLGLWYITGLAMRTCIDLGLHRKNYERGASPATIHTRRRLFWTVYCLERTVTISLGRPLSISDGHIDVDFPDSTFPVSPASSQSDTISRLPNSTNEIPLAIFLFRLRQLESRIHNSIYRPDKMLNALRPKLDLFYEALETWRMELTQALGPDRQALDYPLLLYNRAVRTLIQPFLNILPVMDPYYGLCLRAAGSVCQLHKRLHQTHGYGHSFIAVQTVFVAGATLLYALWTQTHLVWSVTLADDLRACSLVLFVMSERSSWVRKYRDAFEVLVDSAMEKLRKNEPSLRSDMHGTSQTQSRSPGNMNASGAPPSDDNVTTMRASVTANTGPISLSCGGDVVNRDDEDVWHLVEELASWIDQDHEAPTWMPNFETLQNLPYGEPF